MEVILASVLPPAEVVAEDSPVGLECGRAEVDQPEIGENKNCFLFHFKIILHT